MKTTIVIDDELLRRAKIRAAEQRSSLRSVLEEALRRLLSEHDQQATNYKMADRRVHGRGLQPQFEGRTVTELIRHSYEEHRG